MPCSGYGRWASANFAGPAATIVLGLVALGMILAAVSAQPQSVAVAEKSWPTVAARSDPPVAVFIGDSYSVGVGATENSKRWTTLLSAAEGWQEVNIARGGTGYLTTAGLAGCGRQFCGNYQASVKEAIENRPDIAVVAGGQNDQLQDPVAERGAIAKVYQTLRAGLPDAQIIAVGPSSPDAKPGRNIVAIDADVEAAAREAGALYVSLLNPPVVQSNMVLADKTHVDNAGHAAIEQRVAAAITK